MKKTILLSGCLLFAASILPADNLVKNGSFTDLDNRRLPQNWEIRKSTGSTAGSEWSRCSLDIAFPADGKGAYVVLRSLKGTLEFRDVAVVEVK